MQKLLGRILACLVLPPTITAFERSYLARMNRIALAFFWGHLPLFAGLAWLNETGPGLVSLLTLAILAGPTLAYRRVASPRTLSMIYGFTAMCMGGVLVHVGQGPVQIEMHFYFFSVLAMLALFANPLVILVAAGTVSLHHLALWFLVPTSVFNYDAPLWVVLVHAAFVVLETVAACFIARNFFDNVIGLEKKVEERTAEIALRNRDMRLVLDNVRQGFLTSDLQGRLSAERSAVVDRWLGGFESGLPIWELFGRHQAQFSQWLQLAWEGLTDGFLPLELALDQLPRRVEIGGRHLAIEYQPIADASGRPEKLLVVLSDVSAEVARQEAEQLQKEILVVFERILKDKRGFQEFFEESTRLLGQASENPSQDWAATKRAIHTLKGNTALFGLESVARLAHALEERIAERDTDGIHAEFARLQGHWTALSATVERLLGQRRSDQLVISNTDFESLLDAVVSQRDHVEIARRLVDLTLEPATQRLEHFAEQARALAKRLAKGELEVDVSGDAVRLERERFAEFWSSFSHVIRNAVDHGLEAPEKRAELGKPSGGSLRLTTREDGDDFVIEVSDDGRGIDWERVREKAAALGLPAGDQRDLVEALFAPGLTTASEVTETSGRGIGLAAVREACDRLGGSIEVQSDRGRGTSIRFRFPSTARAAYPAPRVQRAA